MSGIVQKLMANFTLDERLKRHALLLPNVAVTLTGRDGDSAPKTVSGATMVQVWWRGPEKDTRLLRYNCYSLHEGIALAEWLHRAASSVSIEPYANLRVL